MFAIRTLILSAWFLPMLAMAAPYSTSYLDLDLPSGWNCETVTDSFVCRSGQNREINSAAMIMVAKVASPEDHLENLSAQLNKINTVKGPKGTLVKSKLEWSRTISLSGHPWLEALQKNSELEGYYTYYLITVANDRNIIIAFNYEISKASTFFPLITKIRDSINLKASLSPKPKSAPIPVAVSESGSPGSSTHQPNAQSAMNFEVLSKNPAFWVVVVSVVCLILLAFLW